MRYVVEWWNGQAWVETDCGDLGIQASIPLTIKPGVGLRIAKWDRAELQTRPQPEVVLVYHYPRSTAAVVGLPTDAPELPTIARLGPAARGIYTSEEMITIEKVNELVAAVNALLLWAKAVKP